MSKVNPKAKSERLAGGMGAPAAVESPLSELRRCTLANLLWEDLAYVDGLSVSDRISELIPKCDPTDVANLAIECRLVQKLRHTPLFIISEMCKYKKCLPYVRKALNSVITRADMITDFLAIYWKNGKKPIPNQVKKGLADCFHKFNEYQFAKYDRDGAIKLRDVMFMVHPTPTSFDEEHLFTNIANRTLPIPDTWEVALSTGKDKKETWTRLIKEGKLGALAMLRNINNMKRVEVEASVIKKGIKEMHASMLLPLDYLKSALINSEFERDIENKMLDAYKSLPKLPGNTLFIVDVSGSMGYLNSGASNFDRLDNACAMAMLAVNQCESYKLVATAGDDWGQIQKSEYIPYPKPGFDIRNQISDTRNRIGGGGIFTRQCLEWCKDKFKDEKFDRIIIFSDSQDCDRKNSVPAPFGKYNYICDVSSHSKGINYKGIWTAEISGWSEHFLTYIAAYEGLSNTFEEGE